LSEREALFSRQRREATVGLRPDLPTLQEAAKSMLLNEWAELAEFAPGLEIVSAKACAILLL
jgi:hypothetical protein